MDIDLKLLGPYAKVYLDGVKANTQKSQPKPNRANFGALHKKQNVRFLLDADGKRQDKRMEMEEKRKSMRSNKFMSKRTPNIAEIANEVNKCLYNEADDSTEISALESSDSSMTMTQEATANGNSKPKLVTGNINSSNNKVTASKIGNQNKVNMTTTNKNLKPVLNSKPLPFSATSQKERDTNRREQLLKWKREKEVADMKSKQTLKQPFKVGVVVGTKSVNSSENLTVNTNAKNSKTFISGSASSIASKNGIVGAPRGPNTVPAARKPLIGTGTAGSDLPSGDARRVTRAMSKAQTITNTGNNVFPTGKFTFSSTHVMKPTIQKMKTLTIAEKGPVSRPGTAPVPSTMSRPVALSQPTKASQASSVKRVEPAQNKKPVPAKCSTIKGNKSASSAVGASASTQKSHSTNAPSNEKTNGPVSVQNNEIKPPEVVKKKLKPKAIDHTYINYNALFSNACAKLGSYSIEWTKILEEKEERTEEVQGDLHSALGKVKLLLQSKLPQFGELLYSYLCQEMDPRPILPCDLEGWWDVVSIQLEAIDKEFKGLTELKQNKWIKVSLPPTNSNSSSQESNDRSSGENQCNTNKPSVPIRRTKPTILAKAQASGGLKAFLAKQRKILTNDEKPDTEIVEPMDVERPPPPPIKEDSFEEEKNVGQDLNASGRTFDGRFFSISSPLAKCTPERNTPKRRGERLSIHRSPAPSFLRTPSRRLSTTNDSSLKRMSFCILGVRQSMGSFNKIGAVPISADDRNTDVENQSEF
ncbi:unnamed protein product [Orchesella dallaii]|uniref:Disks large-associated protein 1 n=1 Tax=Orchesella dallaii TaxID=48710 RepID=A0ABP1Q618_9HEXA